MDYRAILYHKQSTSARTRFLKFSRGSVCAFDPIPMPAQLLEDLPSNTVLHPAPVLRELEERLGFRMGTLEAEGEYRQLLETPGGTIQVVLARITTMDPPFDLAKEADACFIDLTQARGLPQIELELLRHAYELVLGG